MALVAFAYASTLLSSKKEAKSDLYKKVAARYSINHKTLRAIAKRESSERDLVINVNSWLFKGSYAFSSKLSAALFMDLLLDTTGQNYDVGRCQINSYWQDVLEIDSNELLHASLNVDVAAFIYKGNVERCSGNAICALSMYNTGKKNSKIGRAYALSVLKIRSKL